MWRRGSAVGVAGEGGYVIGVMVVEVMRMAWFVERRVWLLWWEDGGSEAVV